MRRTLTLLAVLAALLATAAPAAAITTAEATIDVHSSFSEPGGTFTADSALLCDSGTTSDVTAIAGNGRALTFHNMKTFTCADDSGTFTLRLQANVRFCEPATQGAWNVVGGTGAYEGLKGAGSLVGTYFPGDVCNAEGIDDHLTGVLRLP
jgi:opacity protein-like surface antigen